MNSTTAAASATAQGSHSYDNVHDTVGAAFFGFSIGAILFGITIRQAYQYYTTNRDDQKIRKTIIAVVCFLDTANIIFSMIMVYSLIVQVLGHPEMHRHVIWSLKALATTQVFLVLFVQGFYLSQIWRLSGNLLLSRPFTIAIQVFVIFITVFALIVAGIFMSQLQRIEAILSFTDGFEYVVYLGFGATALIDCAIAAAMCVLLYKSSSGILRTENVLESLIQYFVGTGLLTSFAAILVIVLYVARPMSIMYLGMEFSVTRLYANSVLAMFNARSHLRERLNETIEIKIPTFFRDSDGDSMSQSLIAPTNPFSPTDPKFPSSSKYSPGSATLRLSPNSATMYSPVKESRFDGESIRGSRHLPGLDLKFARDSDMDSLSLREEPRGRSRSPLSAHYQSV